MVKSMFLGVMTLTLNSVSAPYKVTSHPGLPATGLGLKLKVLHLRNPVKGKLGRPINLGVV